MYLLFDRSKCNFLGYDLNDQVRDVDCSTFSKNCKDYFGTFYSSALQLFILLTTANYPDVMMPVYDCQSYTALFFVIYISIGLYFLMSLVLADRNHGKEAWLIQLEKVAFNRNIDISAYKLQLKSHVGDVYKAMYGDTDVVESESFSSDVLDDVLNENNIARNSIDLEVEEISAILDDDDGMLFAGEKEEDDDDDI